MASLSFFARPTPLGDSRSISRTVEKRPASVVVTNEPRRIKKPKTVAPRHPTAEVVKQKHSPMDNPRHRQLMTPQPSSDAPGSDDYVPLPRALASTGRGRLMTPATSTVAASSSPRMFPSSSPSRVRRSHSPAPIVVLTDDVHLLFGRHRHRENRPTTISLPASLHPHVDHSDRPARHVILDRGARHASRQHALVELSGERVRIVVLGQNGMRVRTPGGMTRLARGSVAEYEAGAELELDFYGAAITLRTNERLFTPEPAQLSRESPLSLPPSSPPAIMDLDDDVELSEPEDEDEVLSPPSPSSERSLTPTPRPAPELVAVKQELLDQPKSRASTPKPKSRAATPAVAPEIPPLPTGIDLPALLASTVVFSGSSKLPLPDLVRALLEAQPSLRDHGDETAWAAWAGQELERNDMFGKVSRNGKDSSGRPLLPHYFYNPANDPDAARAKELGGLVRPLRAAQRTGGKVIDWRPVGRGRRL